MTNSTGLIGTVTTEPPAGHGAVLVHRRGGEFGSAHQLVPGRNLGIGRASNNFIVLRDDGASRSHAEVYWADGQWNIQDLGSLNGTRVNGRKIEKGTPLAPGDSVAIGQTELVFFADLGSIRTEQGDDANKAGFAIRYRQNQTSLDLPKADGGRALPSRELQTLYRLALQMGLARDPQELAGAVLNALLEATPADSGSIVRFEEGVERATLALRLPPDQTYLPPSEQVVAVATSEKEALLIEELLDTFPVGPDPAKRSVICAPIIVDREFVALVHLYCSNGLKVLGSEDLDLVVAVAQQLGPALLALERQQNLSTENEQLRETLRTETELVGESKAILDVIAQVGMVAPTNTTVLVRGESGVGKELVARSIHFNSKRREGPFVCLNCAALPETLLESELFGHEKGSFTGATDQKKGKFEVAHKGSIFLDEIGEMTLATQSKLLRVLDGHAFERVGGYKPIRVNVRVIAATNRNLEKAVADGHFRSDLYYRLQVVEVRVPSLRERKEDLPVLARYFLLKFSSEMGRKLRGFTDDAILRIRNYDWPGNVRELKNVIERAVVLTRGPTISANDLGLPPAPPESPTVFLAPQTMTPLSLDQMEAEHIAHTLRFTGWNKSQTAALLGIERSTLDRKIRRYNIQESA